MKNEKNKNIHPLLFFKHKGILNFLPLKCGFNSSRTLLIYSLALIISTSLSGQISFTANVDSRQTTVNNPFQITFSLNNGHGSGFQPPSFSDFQVAGGPNYSVYNESINGNVHSSEAFSFTLVPRKQGRFVIGPAYIKVQGRLLKTDPVTIEVGQAKAAPPITNKSGGGENITLQAIANNTDVFVGQQITLDYKIITSIGLESIRPIAEPNFDAFYTQPVKSDFQAQREQIKGRPYISQIIKRVALFPLKPGDYTLDPMILQVVTNSGDPFDAFFGSHGGSTQRLSSSPIKIHVNPIPASAPTNFFGGVGQYQGEISCNKTELSTDETFTITIKVTGNGDVKRLQGPKLELPESFEVYEPRIAFDDSKMMQGEWIGTRTFEYQILPHQAGTFTIDPKVSFLDPGRKSFQVIGGTKINLQISQGKKPVQPMGASSLAASHQVGPLKVVSANSKGQSHFFGSVPFDILLSLPFLALAGSVIIRRRKDALANMDIHLIRTKRARKISEQKLLQAKTYLDQKNYSAFYDTLLRSIHGYLCDKFSIPQAELNAKRIQDVFAEKGKDSTLFTIYEELVNKCQLVLFAGNIQSASAQQDYQKAMDWMEAVDKG